MGLRELRKRRGLTQNQLSMKSGVAREVIARIETGASKPTIATLTKLTLALDVQIEELIGRITT